MLDHDLEGDAARRERLRRRIGTTLRDRYTLDALLGVGGMACVYRARHRNGNRVAIKVLHAELSVHVDLRARFLREGYLANKVDHAGTVRVLDDDTAEDGAPFIVMELLEGESLETYLERHGGRLSPRETLGFVRPLLEVLQAAHDKGIVHRDLKPENLFITADGLKILDFGIARLMDGSVSATRTGRVLGTPLYMAPEQARGESSRIGPHTDLWSVGAVMFRLLSGRFVFEAETPELTAIAAATRMPEKLAVVAPHLPAELTALVDRALERKIEHRFHSARQMLAASRMIDLARHTEPASLPPLLPRHSMPGGFSTDSSAQNASNAKGVLIGILAASLIGGLAFAFTSFPPHHVGPVNAAPPEPLPSIAPIGPVAPKPIEPVAPKPEPPPDRRSPTPPEPHSVRAPPMGALTIVCSPRCTAIADNDEQLGAGHIFNRPVPSGRHVLELAAGDVVKRVVVEVGPARTREVRISMAKDSYGF